MGQPAAREGDRIKGMDTHVVMVPSGASETRTPTSFTFDGVIDGGLSDNVLIDGEKAAVVKSTATNTPRHLATLGRFEKEPKNEGTIQTGSESVYINGKAAARNGDPALTCNDPKDLPVGKVVASAAATVWIG